MESPGPTELVTSQRLVSFATYLRPFQNGSVAVYSAIVFAFRRQLVQSNRPTVSNKSTETVLLSFFKIKMFWKELNHFCASCHHDNTTDRVASFTTKQKAAVMAVMVLLVPSSS